MNDRLPIPALRLVPAVELNPFEFARPGRQFPDVSGPDAPDAWYAYWLESLADSGVVSLRPVRPGSCFVPTTEFTDPTVTRAFLAATFRELDDPDSLGDPELAPALDGGIAMFSGETPVVEPGCCSGFDNLNEWRRAIEYRSPDWSILWIGHPWLSIQYDAPHLILSEPHEGTTPADRWAIEPDQLTAPVANAEAELRRFTASLVPVLAAMDLPADPRSLATWLVRLER